MTGRVQSIERAAAIVRLLAENGAPVGLADIAAALGLAKPTAHGLLATMVAVGFVTKDPATARYSAGAVLGGAGPVPLDANRLRSSALDHADTLAALTGLPVRVGVLEGPLVRVVHHVFAPGRAAQVLDVNTVRPASGCALGKVLLAHRAGLVPAGPAAAPTVDATRRLAAELTVVRQRGWAVDDGGLRGEAGLAAPVRSAGGLVVAAIGVTGSPDRLLDDEPRRTARLLRHLTEVAAAISARIASGR